MLPTSDYAEAYEMINSLAPDFVHAALSAKVAPNTPEKRDFDTKAAYVRILFEAMKTMNSIRQSVEPPQPYEPAQRRI